jgi:DNA-binding IclR family transcriptional regulator
MTSVRSVSRAIDILECIAENQNMTVGGLSKQLKIPRATTYQLITTLIDRRFLGRKPESPNYVLGSRLFTLASLARSHLDIVRTAAEHLRALNEELNETIHLTVLQQDSLIYVDSYESTHRLRTHSCIGEVGELHCTAVGKALLAFLGHEERNRLLPNEPFRKFTQNTIIDRVGLYRELALTAERGYAVDNVEHEEGVRCVGVPIRDHSGAVTASLSVSGPASRMTPERDREIAERAMAAAAAISDA